MKSKGLGRGLDALLAANENVRTAEALRNLKISQLQPGKYQPRTRMDNESLAELAESIKTQGIMQPVLVRPVSPGRYEIIAGERRWRAAQLAALSEVPALVREVPDEAVLAMVERTLQQAAPTSLHPAALIADELLNSQRKQMRQFEGQVSRDRISKEKRNAI